jgi:hypothetical protein
LVYLEVLAEFTVQLHRVSAAFIVTIAVRVARQAPMRNEVELGLRDNNSFTNDRASYNICIAPGALDIVMSNRVALTIFIYFS